MLRQIRYNHFVFEEEDEELESIARGSDWMTEFFHALGKELDVMEAKSPEDIYKSHLEDKKGQPTTVLDSAKQNLATTFVNAFVNAGFGKTGASAPRDVG